MDSNLQQVVTLAGAVDQELTASAAALASAQGQAAAAKSQIAGLNLTNATLQAQLTAAQAQDAALTAQLAAIPAAAVKPGSLRSLFAGAGWPKLPPMIGHMETWWNQSASHTSKRRPLYDLDNRLQVAALIDHYKNNLGLDGVSTNGYPEGNPANDSAKVVWAELANQNLLIMPNVDKGVWGGATSAQAIQAAIQSYINNVLRKDVLGNRNVFLLDGLKVITFFATGAAAEQIAIAAVAADKQNADLMFVNNVGSFGGHQMQWVQADTIANTAWWIRTFAPRANTRNIVALFKGFNDASDADARQSCWGGPARIWTAPGKAYGMETLLTQRDAIVAGYKAIGKVPDAIQIVTLNDYQEGTNCEGNLTWVPDVLGW